MEDFAIPEEYYSCPADSLFDLLADSLLAFARRLGWCAQPCICGSRTHSNTSVHAGRQG